MGMDKMKTWMKKILSVITIRSDLGRCLMAEFYSTFMLSVFLRAAIAQDLTSGTGSVFNIAFTAGMGVAFAIYSSFGVSGGHINLAVSIGVAVLGKLPWKRVPVYYLAQLAGGFVGAVLVYAVYQDAFDDFDGGERQAFGPNGTAAIFATFPQLYLSVTTGFFEQVLSTALFLAIIGAVLDHRNVPPPLNWAPFFFGLIILALVMTFGHNAGAPLNPSIDLSGRLCLGVMGYGAEVWVLADGTHDGVHWWLIPIFGPAIGGAVGSWAYYLAIELHHPPVDEKEDATDYKEKIELEKKDGMPKTHAAEIQCELSPI
ncbi:aquaporin-10-like isoform X2 [Strongylocentrotus purpuratus]|uniref:Aquaporin-9 n=1 Tax=Strongylocentrotus purpuratus TaxID=7668 RepID=A0A7M7N9S2_STRPU|nr:aquaporin-10-like isoform X2 [Strongylocentrotus purpuratus]